MEVEVIGRGLAVFVHSRAWSLLIFRQEVILYNLERPPALLHEILLGSSERRDSHVTQRKMSV